MRVWLKAVFIVAALMIAALTLYLQYSRMEAPFPEGGLPSLPPTAAIPDLDLGREKNHPFEDDPRLTAPPPPSVQRAPPETVDTALKKLAAGLVAFNVPDHMRLARSQTLEARLAVNVPREQLVLEVTAEGRIKTALLRVSPRMQATLSGGPAFDISPSGPQIQFMSSEESNTWQWQVTPKLEGPQVLLLTFDAFIEVNKKEGLHNVNTLRQQITVDVGWPETPKEWAEWFKKWVEYGGWLWTALLLPMGLFVLRKWRNFHEKPRVAATTVDDPNG